MDWTKLSDSQISDFLSFYHVQPGMADYQEKVLLAKELFTRVSAQGFQVTEPVRDLYIASLVKNNPKKYTRQQILSSPVVN